MPEPIPELYLRLGSHSEKQYILKTAHLFDGVIVGANLLESTPGATVSLALRLMSRPLGRAFAIDPMTYTFGMDLKYIQSETIDRTATPRVKKIGLKRSFKSLAEAYGDPIKSVVIREKRPLQPSDMTPDVADAFAIRVLEYQTTRMRLHWENDPQLKEVANELPAPTFAFAPYFYSPFGFRAVWRQWHAVNIALATTFAAQPARIPKHAVLCIDHSVLSAPTELDKIVRDYIGTGCSGCWIWLSNFVEQDVDVPQLKNLVEVAHKFRDAGVRLYNLHGGFLSALLSKHGLTGLSHGVGYGENKDVVPIIGVTVPTVNYHLPRLHLRVPMLELERTLPELNIRTADDFHKRICDCTVCKGVLDGDLANVHEFGDTVVKSGNMRESQTPDSAKKCRFHFLLARKKEIEKVAEMSLADLKRDLLKTRNEYSSLPTYLALRKKAAHLHRWAAAI